MDKFQNKLENFEKAYNRLIEAVEKSKQSDDSVIRDGVIQRFEFTTELAWKSVREYLINEGIAELNSPKSVMREAFANNLIDNENVWVKLLEDRNKTSNIYDEDESEEIYNRISNEYAKEFEKLLSKLKNVNFR